MEHLQKLKEITSKHLLIPDITNPTRKRKYVEARALMFTILRKNLQHTYEDIGKMFNLTHASVMNGVKEFPYMVTFNI